MKDLAKAHRQRHVGLAEGIDFRRDYIDDMFTLAALLVVWACAAGQMTDAHVVDVACGAGHFDGLLGGIVCAGASAVEDEHAGCSVRHGSGC